MVIINVFLNGYYKGYFRMKITVFITDLDGTLNVFSIDIIKIWDEIMQYLSFLNLLDYFKNIYSITDFFKTLHDLKNIFSKDKYTEIRDKLYSIACKYEYKASENTVAKPYAAELLEYMSMQDVKMGLVSNSCRKAVHHSLNKLGFKKYFDVIISREDTPRIKPYPDQILRILDLFRCKDRETIYLGDSAFDILAGKAAGVITVYLNDGELNYAGDLDEKPDYIIRSLKEFPQLWEKYFL